MEYIKGPLLYEGKAKRVFLVHGHDHLIIQDFKDSLTALNGLKKGSFGNKGHFNRDICSVLFRTLSKAGVQTHWLQDLGSKEQVTHKLNMIKLEVVVRNVLAGSTAKKFGLNEGRVLEKPLVELYYKDDILNDPFISDDQALMMNLIEPERLQILKLQALRINDTLKSVFLRAKITLVDFKLEFGLDEAGNVVLADEISPDTCRLWDSETQAKLDKDRFRRNLDDIEGAYKEVHRRLLEL